MYRSLHGEKLAPQADPYRLQGAPIAGAIVTLSLAFGALTCAIFGPLGVIPAQGQGQSANGASGNEFDYAEIYVDRYFENDGGPDLSAAGERKSQALALYSRGLMLEQKGDFEGAARIYLQVLEIIPQEAELAKTIAYLLAQEGETGDGQEVLENFLSDNPASIRAYLNFSEYLATFHSGDKKAREKAIEIAERAEKRFPNSAEVYEHLVKMYIVARRRSDAEDAVRRAMERDVKGSGYWMRIAAVAQRLWPPKPGADADLERVNRIYDKALRHGRGNLVVEVRIAEFYHSSRQFERARDLFLEVLERHPESLEVRTKLAEVYGALGDSDKVIATLTDLAQINPQDLTAQKQLARIYLTQARTLSEQVVIDPSKAPLLEEKIDRSIEHFLNAFDIAKGAPGEYIQVSGLLLNRRRAAEAVEMLQRAVFYYPDMPELERRLAYAFSVDDRFGDALKHFETAVALSTQQNPDLLDAEFFFQFGAAAEQTKDFDRAEKLFKKSMALLSEDDIESEDNQRLAATLYNYLGYMWLERDRNINEAGELIRTAYEMSPDSGAISDSMGWFYFKKGRYEEARTELLKAKELMPEPDSVVYDHLAQTVFQLGDKAGALEYIQKAIDLEPENQDFRDRLKELEAAEAPAPPPKKETEPKPKKPESDTPPAPKSKPKPKPSSGQPARAA